jgi:hypothetical protein
LSGPRELWKTFKPIPRKEEKHREPELTNSYAKSTNIVNRVEGHLDEELFRIALG